MPIRKINVGDPFVPSAELHNRTVDLLRRDEANRRRLSDSQGHLWGPELYGVGSLTHYRFQAVELTGTLAAQYGASGAINDGWFDSPILNIATPNSNTVQSQVGIMQGVAETNRPAPVMVQGISFVYLDTTFSFPGSETWEDYPFVEFTSAKATPVKSGIHRIVSVPALLTGQEVPAFAFVSLGNFAENFKPLVRFTLGSALTLSDASKTATVTHQYGVGKDQVTTANGITVHNLETHTSGSYVFEGDASDAGLAMLDAGTDYRIIQMECP